MKEDIINQIVLAILLIAALIGFFFLCSEIDSEEQEWRSGQEIQRFWESDEDFHKRCAGE